MTKRDDLAAHQSGTLKIEVLTPSEEHIQLIGGVAIVNVRMHISGSYAGVSSESDFRFTRVWAHTSGGSWHVVAAYSMSGLRVSSKRTCRLPFSYIRHGLTGRQ